MTEPHPSKNYERELGGIQERLKSIEETLVELQKDSKETRDVLVGVKGGWKTISVIVGVSATIGAIAGKLTPLMAFFTQR